MFILLIRKFRFLKIKNYTNNFKKCNLIELIFLINYLVGVPITVLLLDSIADRLRCNFSCTKINKQKEAIQKDFFKKSYCEFFKILVILILIIYIIPSLIFSQLTEQNWSFIDSLYFCYTSISTIGSFNYIFFYLY